MTIARQLRQFDDRAGVRVERPRAFVVLLVAFFVLTVGAFALSLVSPAAGLTLMVLLPTALAAALMTLGRKQQ